MLKLEFVNDNYNYIRLFTIAFMSVLSVLTVFLGFALQAKANLLVNIPVRPNAYNFNNEIYSFVQRAIVKGWAKEIHRGILPFSRGEIAALLTEVTANLKSGKFQLSEADATHLASLNHMFADELDELDEIKKLEHKTDKIGESDSIKVSDSKLSRHFLESKREGHHFYLDMSLSQGGIFRTGSGSINSNNSNSTSGSGRQSISGIFPLIVGKVDEDLAFSTNIGYYFLSGSQFPEVLKDENRVPYTEDLVSAVAIEAYAKLKLKWFDLEVGRDSVRWGPGYHSSLLLSANPPSSDMIKLQKKFGRFKFDAFTEVLRHSSGSPTPKYLSGHRVEALFHDKLALGISEVVVYGKRFELAYLNPFSIYLATEPGIRGSTDNILVSGDFRFKPFNNIEIYGEGMVDDANPTKPLKHWDTKFGILGGIYLTDPLGLSDLDFHAEYAFVNQYAYTHEIPIDVYMHLESPLGHKIGADADNFWLEIRRRFTKKVEARLIYELERHGEGNINKPHPSEAPKDDRWKPLSGITQSSNSLAFGVDYLNLGHYRFRLEYKITWVQNLNNKRYKNATGREFFAQGMYRF